MPTDTKRAGDSGRPVYTGITEWARELPAERAYPSRWGRRLPP